MTRSFLTVLYVFLRTAVNATMAQCGGIPNGMLSAVLSVWLAPDNKYAFVEMCTTDCAAVALGLNGILLNHLLLLFFFNIYLYL